MSIPLYQAEKREKIDIVEMLRNSHESEKGYVTLAAPMVRYSKLPFRMLCRKWGADIAFTPMIIAEGFNRSEHARDSEFSTTDADRPLIAQFATNRPRELVNAARACEEFVDAIDLNCGCPQRWAVKEQIGAFLSAEPEIVHNIVKETVSATSNPVSIKIRIHKDFQKTIDLIHAAESAGAAWISVHGRTVEERSKVPVHVESIKMVKEHATVPIIANGDIFMPRDIERIVEETGVNGVMSARGILANPALFKGYDEVPLECIVDFLKFNMKFGTSAKFSVPHNHFIFMMSRYLSKSERQYFSQLTSMVGINDFFVSRGWI